MTSKRADGLPAGNLSPPARNESPQRESSLEGQQPKNDASTSISHGPASPSARTVGAATTQSSNTVSNNLASNSRCRHPLPTFDPSWSNPIVGATTRAYWRDPFHTRCDAWDGGSAPPDEGAFSSCPDADFDVKRSRA